MTIKTSELNRSSVIACASIGASILRETRRVLEEQGIGSEMALACLASAVCGALKATDGMTADDFVVGVESCDEFWDVKKDSVVFLQPDEERIDQMFDDVAKGGN